MTLYEYKQKPIFTGIQKSYLVITWDGQNVLKFLSLRSASQKSQIRVSRRGAGLREKCDYFIQLR